MLHCSVLLLVSTSVSTECFFHFCFPVCLEADEHQQSTHVPVSLNKPGFQSEQNSYEAHGTIAIAIFQEFQLSSKGTTQKVSSKSITHPKAGSRANSTVDID